MKTNKDKDAIKRDLKKQLEERRIAEILKKQKKPRRRPPTGIIELDE